MDDRTRIVIVAAGDGLPQDAAARMEAQELLRGLRLHPGVVVVDVPDGATAAPEPSAGDVLVVLADGPPPFVRDLVALREGAPEPPGFAVGRFRESDDTRPHMRFVDAAAPHNRGRRRR